MSKNRFRPIVIPKGVTVSISGPDIKVNGPRGTLERKFGSKVQALIEQDKVLVQTRENTNAAAAEQGTTRSLIINMINGVVKGFEKTLIIEGTGYRAQMSGSGLQLFLGYSKPVTVAMPKYIN